MASIAKYRRAYFALVKEAGIEPEDRHAVQAELTGKASTTDWTEADWDKAVGSLQRDLGQHDDGHAHVCNDRPRGVSPEPGEWATPDQAAYIQDLIERVKWHKGPVGYFIGHYMRGDAKALRRLIIAKHVERGLRGRDLWARLTRLEASDFIKALEKMARVYPAEGEART